MKSNAARAGMAATLLVIGFLLANALPSSLVSGRLTTQVVTFYQGTLAVEVQVQNSSGVYVPAQGDAVVVTQQALNGVHASLRTNSTGGVELPLPPGGYTVAVSEQRFQVVGNVTVDPGGLSRVQVSANRTAYLSSFSDLQDLPGSGMVEPWEQVTVALAGGLTLSLGGFVYFQGVPAGEGSGLSAPPTFGHQVFVEPVTWGLGGTLTQGKEVLALVLTQAVQGGAAWLQLQPTRPLTADASFLAIVTYEPGFVVVISAP
jgi:hypothetical protein